MSPLTLRLTLAAETDAGGQWAGDQPELTGWRETRWLGRATAGAKERRLADGAAGTASRAVGRVNAGERRSSAASRAWPGRTGHFTEMGAAVEQQV